PGRGCLPRQTRTGASSLPVPDWERDPLTAKRARLEDPEQDGDRAPAVLAGRGTRAVVLDQADQLHNRGGQGGPSRVGRHERPVDDLAAVEPLPELEDVRAEPES